MRTLNEAYLNMEKLFYITEMETKLKASWVGIERVQINRFK